MRFSLNQHSKYSGFTLLEMLVVASIIIILSIIVVTNYELGGYQFNLQRSAYKLAQDIRRAGEMAMSVKEFGDPPSVPAGGYGIFLDSVNFSGINTYYVLFADKNGNGQYNTSTNPLVDETVEGPIYFEEHVEINFLCLVGGYCGSAVSITFIPPDPAINFSNQPDVSLAEITLYSRKLGEEVMISVNPAGLIEIQ